MGLGIASWPGKVLQGLKAGMLAIGVLCSTGVQAQSADASPLRRFFDPPASGLSFASDEVRRLQADELGNPAMLLVDEARRLWSESPKARAGRPGEAGGQGGDQRDDQRGAKSCAACHGAVEAMKGVATRYPQVAAGRGLINLEARINACRTGQQSAPAWGHESPALLGMTALVAMQSRGLSTRVSIEGPALEHFEAGRALYYRRMGQMNLSCAHCHEKNAGRRLLAEVISQGQSNAYPIYRLEWQATGSLHRRFRSCLNGVRAQLWPQGAPEFLDLELFLAWRSQGLGIETPGVRR